MDTIIARNEGEVRLLALIEQTKNQTLEELLAENDATEAERDMNSKEARLVRQFLKW